MTSITQILSKEYKLELDEELAKVTREVSVDYLVRSALSLGFNTAWTVEQYGYTLGEASAEGGLVNGHISGRLTPLQERLEDNNLSHNIPEAIITVNPNGIGVKRQRKTSPGQPQGGGLRREIYGRSAGSNRRLMEKISKIDLTNIAALDKRQVDVRSVFLTLTYPKEFPTGRDSKRDLKAFRKRLERAYPGFDWAIWLQEAQRRGAPHYHLPIAFKETIDIGKFRAWVSENWYEVVGSGDIKHLKAGTRVDVLHVAYGSGSLMSYLAKEIWGGSAKGYQHVPLNPDTGELMPTGRTWGFWREENIPFALLATFAVYGVEDFEQFKRNVAQYYSKSPYLGKVDQYKYWAGGLLFGDGMELMERLLLDDDIGVIREGLPYRYSYKQWLDGLPESDFMPFKTCQTFEQWYQWYTCGEAA